MEQQWRNLMQVLTIAAGLTILCSSSLIPFQHCFIWLVRYPNKSIARWHDTTLMSKKFQLLVGAKLGAKIWYWFYYNCQADDFGQSLEVLNWILCCHSEKLGTNQWDDKFVWQYSRNNKKILSIENHIKYLNSFYVLYYPTWIIRIKLLNFT